LTENIIKEIKLNHLPNFPDNYINNLKVEEIKNIPFGRNIKVENTLKVFG